ncbi:acetylglutamate kinase [Halalkalibacter akibai]|uniref:Acetylglutamate kinase n=1 Tax=Halalkalibacter akibai (strain ATCC 43226 / DSM 21942 / CIP 109018 / JCM 9157 / 1139) TaxID=1236973 RepID=W4QTF6_HALA3|nr:acetylglutamate kinase [Halalkalibacter akibai]GAE35415.1 acetylglutamate kinase [Halalkalibacter akibai JCM 9157]
MKDVVVIKCGGSTIAELSPEFFSSVVKMQESGKHPIIVHGGGPAINQLLQKLDIKSEFVDGLRKTTADVLETAEMVLCGKVNKQVVTSIHQAGGKAVGLSGCDGKLIEVNPINEGMLGYVGEPTKVNTGLLHSLMELNMIPVIAPIGMNQQGVHYNVNADSAAAAIAKELGAEQLVFVTDVDGILKDGKCLEQVTAEEIEAYIADGTIYGGMLPKVKAALSTLTDNLESVMIMNGKSRNVGKDGAVQGTKIMKTKQKLTVS